MSDDSIDKPRTGEASRAVRHEDKETEPHWRTVERTIAALESMLQPGAIVSHNQWLTELATGTRRQCDVVIRSGLPPRDTLTIVEVQDRGRRVELSDYEGWCQKREKLGAQHVICVSAIGFPESVQRDAALRGGVVRLMTLLDPGVFPPFFTPRESDLTLEVVELYDMDLLFDATIPQDVGGHRLDAKIFVADQSRHPISAMDIAEAERAGGRVRSMRIVPAEGDKFDRVYELDLKQPGPQYSFATHGQSQPLAGLRVVEHCRRYHHKVALEPLAYEQIGFDESLGWIFWGVGRHEGEQFSLRIPITRAPGGGLRLGATEVTPTKGHTLLGGGTTFVYSTK